MSSMPHSTPPDDTTGLPRPNSMGNGHGAGGLEDRRANSWSSGHGSIGGQGGMPAPPGGRNSYPTPTLPSINNLHESPSQTLPHFRASTSRSPETQARGLGPYSSAAGQHQQGDGSAWFLGGTGSRSDARLGYAAPPAPSGSGAGTGEWDRPGTARPGTSGSIAPEFGAYPGPSNGSYSNRSSIGQGQSSTPNRMSLTGGLLNPMDDYEYPPMTSTSVPPEQNQNHTSGQGQQPQQHPPPFEQRMSNESVGHPQAHESRGFDALLEGLDAAAGNEGGLGASAGELGDAARRHIEEEDQLQDDTDGQPTRPKGSRAGSGGKRPAEGYDDGSEEYKRKKALIAKGLVSCEACRRGKRKCEPHPLVPLSHPDIARLPCERCRRFALECIRERAPKRKGPAPVDLSAISDAKHGLKSEAEEASAGPSRTQSGSGTAGMGSGQGLQGMMGSDEQHLPGSGSGNGLGQGQAQGSGQGSNVGLGYGDMGMMSAGAPMGASASSGPSSVPNGPSPAFPLLASSPSYSLGTIPDNLDQVVSGNVIDSIVGLFFDYVYPLTPCLHRPTFIANLTNRLDKTDPVFFALTLTVLASTLVQVPRSLVNLDKTEVENLARRCVRVARAKIAYIWEESVPVQSSFVVIAYLEGIVHLLLGNNTAHVICTANANQLALTMRLNEESSYEGLDPIESEIRRRIYWLLFQADKSTACMRARSINLRLEDAAQLRLPAEVDDEQITPTGILPQPIGRTPIIAGFNIVTDLFRTLNDALILQRRRTTSTIDSLLADLQSVNELKEKVMRTAMDVATPLKLSKATDSRLSSPAHDWEAKLQARFLDFFQAPADESHTLNSFLVLQGNILVTQHVVRLVLLQTREALLQQLAVLTQMPVQGIGRLAGMQADEPAEDIACELLDGLNSLPVECVATNGPSLVQKVRFVAIQLMECSVSPSPTTARAQKLLMQFLSVLSVIEGMYTFGKDISAE